MNNDERILPGSRQHCYYAKLEGKKVVPVERLEDMSDIFKNDKARRVGIDEIDGVKVSTVFLAINHGWNGRDLWFETMIFGGDLEGECERYQTFEQAEAGHAKWLTRVKEGWKPDDESTEETP